MLLHPVVILLALFGGKVLAQNGDHCRNNSVDVTLILDTSKAVTDDEILKIVDFAMKFVEDVDFSEHTVQLAVIKLSTTARTVFSFIQNNNKLWPKEELLNMIDGMTKDATNSQGLTGLANALDQAVGLKGRRGVHDVTIVITAGAETRTAELEINANTLKGISEVFVIGVGPNVNKDQMNIMATEPLHIIELEDILPLASVMDVVFTYLCPPCECPDGQVCKRNESSCITPVKTCTDFTCDKNAYCTDTVFSHTCVCNGNTIMDPIFGCFSPLPCVQRGEELCAANEVCHDITSFPLYECKCAPGYTGVAGSCDELKCFHEEPCDQNALCTDNADLSVNCECIPPFIGLGSPGNCISCGDEHVRLVLVVDNAKSGPHFRHFGLVQVFLMELVDLLTISPNSMAVSVITTTPSKTRIVFNDFVNDKRGLMNEISNIQLNDGESDMVGALALAHSILPVPAEGDPRNAVIVLTSGVENENGDDLMNAALELHVESDSEVFVIGLGLQSRSPSLDMIASDPDEVIIVEQLSALIDITSPVRDLLCPPCLGGCAEGQVCDRSFSTCVQAVDECSLEECQEFGFCTNLPFAQDATCSCSYLFVRIKTKTGDDVCYSPSTCVKQEDDCHEDAICKDSPIPGEYSCDCKPDYLGDGRSCIVKPCSPSDTTCDPNADCTIVNGAASCSCAANYQGDGFKCTAVPCSPADTTCDEHADCELAGEQVSCTCAANYQGDGRTCTMIPCSEADPTCDENANCGIVDGQPECTCKTNYEGNGQNCTVIPCSPADTSCGLNADCTNVDGKSVCTCATNYKGDGITCTAEPCSPADTKCDENANCDVVNEQAVCSCKENFEGDGVSCSIMPCSPPYNPCSDFGTCFYENGAVTCTCTRGYTGDGYTCTVIPCGYADTPCDINANCEVVDGRASCSCKESYEWNGVTCVEMPCSPTFSPCSTHASCLPENGEAKCTCEFGFDGDGKTCIANPCSYNTHGCDEQAVCVPTNVDPFYNCNCNNGYYGWGYDGLCHQQALLNGCEKRDVIFLIRTTLSMDMKIASEFAARVVSEFPPTYRVAVMTFTYECVVVKPFNDVPHSVTAGILSTMGNTQQLAPGYNYVGLQEVINLMVGSDGDRPDADNVVIVLTHGSVMDRSLFDQASLDLKAAVSRVIFVGVEASNENWISLSGMASPGDSNLFNIKDLTDIIWNMESVTSSLVCPNIFEQYRQRANGNR